MNFAYPFSHSEGIFLNVTGMRNAYQGVIHSKISPTVMDFTGLQPKEKIPDRTRKIPPG
jgi:hypothetical protein